MDEALQDKDYVEAKEEEDSKVDTQEDLYKKYNHQKTWDGVLSPQD